MSAVPGRILLLFLDGVGIGMADPRVNPLAAARLPRLQSLLGGRLPVREAVAGGKLDGDGAVLISADATLGVPGRPQSGTGQTALLTGINAPARFGRHFGPWVPTGLRECLAEENLLTRAVREGRSAAFANAYPDAYIRSGGERRPAAPPLAARAAGLLWRDSRALREGRAVASSLTHEAWRAGVDPAVPEITPAEAGRVLGSIAAEAELTLFAHYDTDLVGHQRDLTAAVTVLERVDAFLCGLLEALPDDALLVLTSDHGNVEDVTAGHTRNPVPVIAVGPGRGEVARQVRSIADVTPVLLTLLRDGRK